MYRFLLFVVTVLTAHLGYSQGCCSGGSGSPIAGGVSQGVLLEDQMELSANLQYLKTNRFFIGEEKTDPMFDHLSSNYLYLRAAYGLTKSLTMSVETGYFLNKTQIGLDGREKIHSSGIADLILFPRFNVYNETDEKRSIDVTVGLGVKIPLGKYNDSNVVFTDPYTGEQFYTISPPTIQPTTGSNDFIFYGFVFRGFPQKQFRVFGNLLYVKKGWNPLGQRFGDYASAGVFASKTLFENLALTAQIKGEIVGKMKTVPDIDMLALYNIDTSSTGSQKLLFVPQVSYTFKRKLTAFVLAEIPLYQYLNGTQVGSHYQVTTGLSYRFFVI